MKPLPYTIRPDTSAAMSKVFVHNQSIEFEASENNLNIDEDYQLSRLHSTYKKVFESLLTRCGWDMFLIYKSNHEHRSLAAKHLIASVPELRMGRNYFDQWWTLIRVPLLVVLGYLCIKLTLTSLVKIADVLLLDHIFDSSVPHNGSLSIQAQFEEFTLLNSLRRITPSHYQAALEQVVKRDQSVRDLFRSLTGVTVFLEIILAPPLFLLYIVVPRLYRKNPLNSPNQRFMFDPKREICRIDFVIKKHLRRILHESLGNQIVRNQLKQVADLRPCTFSAKWHRSLYDYSMIMSLVWLCQSVIWLAAAVHFFYGRAKRDLCMIRQIEDCVYGNLFDWDDTLYLCEVSLATYLGATYYSQVIVVLISINIIFQLTIVRSLSEDLNQCLATLSAYNTRSEELEAYNSGRSQLAEIHRVTLHGQPLDSGYLRGQGRVREKEVELSLLRTYIKLVVANDEIKQNAQFMGRMIETALSMIGFIVFTIFVSLVYGNSKIQATHVVVLTNCFLFTNPAMLACSFVFARTTELEKIAWSILAKLSIYQDLTQRKGSQSLYNPDELIEVLARRWRKLVGSYTLSNRGIASSLFGLSMTYKRIINIDFFIISAVLVLMTH